MKTIKIFLASSEELKEERLEFADLVLQLNDLFEKRDIQLRLVKWEHLDASMGVKHKQEEYNDKLRECELCLTLYWNKFGGYTAEELETAYNELKEGRNPRKLYVFFKDATEITPELQQFKDSFATNYGHFFCKFENVDTMRLQFLLQLEAYQNSASNKLLKVENQKVTVEGTPVVDLNNVPFASMNKEFARLRDALDKTTKRIERCRRRLEEDPSDEDSQEELNEYLAERNKMQEEFDIIQNALLNTAIKVAQLKGEEYDELLQRAIEAFEEGNLERTHFLLQEASLKVTKEREAYKLKKTSLAADRSNLVSRIKQLLLDAEAVIGVESYTIEERIEKADFAYNEALLTAREIDYDKEKYASLVFKYARFSDDYAKYDKAQELYLEHIELCKELEGEDSEDLAISYNNVGLVYYSQNDYANALKYFKKALSIFEEASDWDCCSLIDSCYNNIGSLYDELGDYSKALEYHFKALEIRENELGDDSYIAMSYDNIGVVYDNQGDSSAALEYCNKALVIRERVLGVEHPDTAISYNNMGLMCSHQGDYTKALDYYFRSLAINEKMFGIAHPVTATIYDNIGCIYKDQDDCQNALVYHKKALEIREKVFGKEHTDTAFTYNGMGAVYSHMEEYSVALEYYEKALAIFKKILGKEHSHVAIIYENIGLLYDNKEDSVKALEYYKKALVIYEKVFGVDSCKSASLYNVMAGAFYGIDDCDTALVYYRKELKARLSGEEDDSEDFARCYTNIACLVEDFKEKYENHKKALEMRIKVLGSEDLDTAQSYYLVADACIDLGKLEKSLEYLKEALKIRIELLENDDMDIAVCYNNIGYVYNEMGEYEKAAEAHQKALEIREKVFGVEDVDTARSYHHLGRTYNYLEQYGTALEYLNKALKIRERELGEDDELTIATREQIEIASSGEPTPAAKPSALSKFKKLFKK